MGRHVACCCGFGAWVLGVEGGEYVAGYRLVFWVRGVEERETCCVQKRDGRFGFVPPVRGCFREGGFDLRFTTLRGVEGDLEGY